MYNTINKIQICNKLKYIYYQNFLQMASIDTIVHLIAIKKKSLYTEGGHSSQASMAKSFFFLFMVTNFLVQMIYTKFVFK